MTPLRALIGSGRLVRLIKQFQNRFHDRNKGGEAEKRFEQDLNDTNSSIDLD
jgi:hypothetical protein